MQGLDHGSKLKSQVAAAQNLAGKYMPGESGGAGGGDDDAPQTKEAQKEAQKMMKDASKAKAAAEAALRGEAPPSALVSTVMGLFSKFSKGSSTVMPVGGMGPSATSGTNDSGLLSEDTGFGPLRAEEYVQFRTLPKLIYFSQQSPKQARQVAIFEVAAIGLSTCCSLLAAFDKVQPVPLIVQGASTAAAWVAYKNMKTALKLTNSAVGQLERLVLWWQSLSMIEKRRPDKKEKLVRVRHDFATPAYFSTHRSYTTANALTLCTILCTDHRGRHQRSSARACDSQADGGK